jgi:hypothetical protein
MDTGLFTILKPVTTPINQQKLEVKKSNIIHSGSQASGGAI